MIHLRRGDTGPAVEQLQRWLVIHNCLQEVLEGDPQIDGKFGRNTQRAVYQFQTKRGLPVTGLVDSVTYTELQKADPKLPVTWHEAFVAVAQEELAKGVREVGGSNRGPDVLKYLISVSLKAGSPWCMAFVYWCGEEATRRTGVKNRLVKTGHCMTAARRYQAYGWMKQPDHAQVGDIVIWRHSGDSGHTGIVVGVRDASLITIEGNTNDDGAREGYEVARMIRPKNKVSFVVRIPKDGDA